MDRHDGGDSEGRPRDDGPESGGHGYVIATLPDDCPVTPLGVHGANNHLLDYRGQLITLGSEFRKGEVMQLFGERMGWLVDVFPQYGKPQGNLPAPCVGFDQKRVQEALIMACSKRGIFNPAGRVRGRGAHKGTHGELYLHCGDRVVVAGEWTVGGKTKPVRAASTGLVAGLVFPSDEALPAPDPMAAGVQIGATILSLIRSWNWKDPIHALLAFSWLPTANLGGALRRRPHMWLVGPSGAGKTSLQEMFRALMGPWAIATEDATEAGLRQCLNQDTLAVMFDEMEPDEDSGSVHKKIVKLARNAYSSDENSGSVRGTSDHKAAKFRASSCFLFSSINHFELEPQDRNRMAICRLSPFPPNSKMPAPQPMLPLWGNQLRRRLCEQWPRFAETLEIYFMQMMRKGFSGREQDTYGHLLACADLLLFDHAPPDYLTAGLNAEARSRPLIEWLGDKGAPIERLTEWLTDGSDRVAELVDLLEGTLSASRTESEADSDRCLRHLTSHRLPAKSGEEQQSVERWIVRAMVQIFNSDDGRSATHKLAQHGIGLVQDVPESGESGGKRPVNCDKPIYVAVAGKTHASMAELFNGSKWKGGEWVQTLGSIDGAMVGRKVRFGGPDYRAVLIPVDQMINVQDAREEASRVAAGRAG